MMRHILFNLLIVASLANAILGSATVPPISPPAIRRALTPYSPSTTLLPSVLAQRLEEQRRSVLTTVRQLRQDLLRYGGGENDPAVSKNKQKTYGSQLTRFPSRSRARGRRHPGGEALEGTDTQAVLQVARGETGTLRLVKRRKEKIEEGYYRVTYADREDWEDDDEYPGRASKSKSQKAKSGRKSKSKSKSKSHGDSDEWQDDEEDDAAQGLEVKKGGGRSGYPQGSSKGGSDSDVSEEAGGSVGGKDRSQGLSTTKGGENRSYAASEDVDDTAIKAHQNKPAYSSSDRQKAYGLGGGGSEGDTTDPSTDWEGGPSSTSTHDADEVAQEGDASKVPSTETSGPGSVSSKANTTPDIDIGAHALPLGDPTAGAIPPTPTKSDGSPNQAGLVPFPTLTGSLPTVTDVADPQPTELDSNLEYLNEVSTPIHMPRHPIFWQECVALSRLYVEMAGPLWLYQQGWELAPAYYELYKDREARPGWWTKWPGGVNYYEGPQYPEGYEEREDGKPGAQRKKPKQEDGASPLPGDPTSGPSNTTSPLKNITAPLDNFARRRLLEKRRSSEAGYGRQSNSSEPADGDNENRNLTMPICCKWSGIGCSKDGDVVHLDLAGYGLAGNFSDAPFEFNRLLRMNLSDNAILGRIPDEFEQLPYLQDIYLRNNLITGPVPDSMQKSGQGWGYSHVDLSHNGLTGHASINMDVIRQIDVSHNRLNTIELQMQPSLRYILTRRVDLSYNYLSGAMPDLQEATEIVNFTAYGNNFTGPLFNISRLHRLQNLDVRHNALDGPFPLSILNSSSIRSFKIGFNKFTGPFPDVEAPPNLVNCTARPNTFDSYPAKSPNNRTLANVCGVYGNLRVPGILDPILDDDLDAPQLNGTVVPVEHNQTNIDQSQGFNPVLPKTGANSFAAVPASSSAIRNIPSPPPGLACMLAILSVLIR